MTVGHNQAGIVNQAQSLVWEALACRCDHCDSVRGQSRGWCGNKGARFRICQKCAFETVEVLSDLVNAHRRSSGW